MAKLRKINIDWPEEAHYVPILCKVGIQRGRNGATEYARRRENAGKRMATAADDQSKEQEGARLATVRLGSGSGVMCPNLNLHLTVRFRHLPNTNMNKRFGFNMFGSGSNPVQHKKSQLYLQISNTVGQKMLVKRFPTRQFQNRDLSPSKPHLQPEVDHQCPSRNAGPVFVISAFHLPTRPHFVDYILL